MHQLNGMIRIYCALVIAPILFGRRRERLAYPEEPSGRCYDVLIKECMLMMLVSAARIFSVVDHSAARLILLIAEFAAFYGMLDSYAELIYIRIRGEGQARTRLEEKASSRGERQDSALGRGKACRGGERQDSALGRGKACSREAVHIRFWVRLICALATAYWAVVIPASYAFPGNGAWPGGFLRFGQIWSYAVFALDFLMIIRCRRRLGPRSTQLYLTHILLPLAGTVLYYITGGLGVQYVGITFSVLLIYIMRNEAQGAQALEEMQLGRLALMESEIRPHFLFNCINSIYSLCAEDPAKAHDASKHLEKYLEGSFAALDTGGLVPMETELDHIRNYLALEELRFGDKLKVCYELGETGFMIPFLTVQPLVENAVKHGIRRKASGGTVKISTRKMPEGAEILVEDDGAGFDVSSIWGGTQAFWGTPTVAQGTPPSLRVPSTGVCGEGGGAAQTFSREKHIGLANVRRRLDAELQATLELESVPGNGTCARIFIPSESLREVPV